MHSSLNKIRICLGVICAIVIFSPTFVFAEPHVAVASDLDGHEWDISTYFLNRRQTWPYEEIGQKIERYIVFKNGIISGSPGCGQFTSTYHRSDLDLTISAEWADRKETPCNHDAKDNAKNILSALLNVRRIRAGYWHNDDLILTDANGVDQVIIGPKQAGSDLSEFQDTFWRLIKLQGTNADISDAIIEIGQRAITFSTPLHSRSISFGYQLTGLQFFSVFSSSGHNDVKSSNDRKNAQLFEVNLHKIASYKANEKGLSFFDRNGELLIALNLIREKSIEIRRWRIAKYRGDGNQQGDDDDLVEAKERAEITLLNGRVEGSPGCGGWVGGYEHPRDHLLVPGDCLSIWGGVVLAGYCSPEEFAQGHIVAKAFHEGLQIEEKSTIFCCAIRTEKRSYC